MIRGMHGMFRSSRADEVRAFLRDKLRLPATDVGGGWLIFDLPEADIGVHPQHDGDGHHSGEHDVSFYTDDVKGTVAELQGRGVVFDQAIEDHGYGFVTYFTMPGDVKVQLYEPKYVKQASAKKASAKQASAKKAAAKKTRRSSAAKKVKAARPKRAAKRPAKRKRR